MIVYAPGLFTHMLDVGVTHEPFGHILMNTLPDVPPTVTQLVPLVKKEPSSVLLTVDLLTLDVVPLKISKELLVETFHNNQCLENRLAILHFFIVHMCDFDTVTKVGHIVIIPFQLFTYWFTALKKKCVV